LVVARQRCSDEGIPQRLIVKHSSSPSRKLLAAFEGSRFLLQFEVDGPCDPCASE
jgi:hypothetical protein